MSFIGWGYLLGVECVRWYGLYEKLSGIIDSWLSRSVGCVKLVSVSESLMLLKLRLKRFVS